MKREEKERGPLHRNDPVRLSSKPGARDKLPLDPGVLSQLQTRSGNQRLLRLLEGGVAKPKLSVSQPGDAEEVEADREAENAAAKGSQESLPEATATPLQSEAGRDDVRRKSSGGGMASAPDDLLQRVGPGRSLDPAILRSMESSFGQDFSEVRIHAGPAASSSASQFDARAFTVGSHIVFGEGESATMSGSGRRLLAHELAHVVQNQKSGKPDPHSAQGSATIKRDSLAGKASSFFSEKTQAAGKWIDEKKWGVYRALIAGMKKSKNAAVAEMRGLVPKLASSLQGPANTIIDVVDFVMDMIDALALAIIGLAAGFVEGIVGLIMGLIKLALGLIKLVIDALVALLGKPDEFHQDLDDLAAAVKGIPSGLKKVVDEWLERYKHATLEEQVLMGGELVGQIEAFIATFAFAGTKAGQAGSLTVRTGTRAFAVAGGGALREAPAAATVVTSGVIPKTAAEAAVITSQAMMSSGSGGGGGSQASAAQDSEEDRLQKKYGDRSETKYPASEWKRIEQLEEKYPKLKSARLRPVRRPTTGDEAIFEERMQTTQSPYSLAGYTGGEQVVQFDGISPNGFVEEIKIQQSMEKVDDIMARLRYQQGFARDYGLKGVEYSINPPSVAGEVERRVAEEHLSNVYRAHGQ